VSEQKPFDYIADEWFARWDGKIPASDGEGYEALKDLLECLKTEGYSREDLYRKVNIIIGYCVNTNMKDKSRLKGWMEATEKRLRRAIGEVYSDSPSHKERAPVEQKETPAPAEDPALPGFVEECETFGKEIDRTLLGDEKLDIEYDPEMSKLLGYDDE
jgi:hypothetical protein